MGSKTQYVGLLLIFIMFFSSVAFGIISSIKNDNSEGPQQTPQGKEVTIERHTKRLLSESEKNALLQQGAAILEFLYSKDCSKCAEYRPVIESFSTKFNNILLVDAEYPTTTIRITGKETKQIENVTEKALLDAYCEVSLIQQKDCILKNF